MSRPNAAASASNCTSGRPNRIACKEQTRSPASSTCARQPRAAAASRWSQSAIRVGAASIPPTPSRASIPSAAAVSPGAQARFETPSLAVMPAAMR